MVKLQAVEIRMRILWKMKEKKPYTEIPSSLIIYPIPYPSAATGPNPNSLNAGLPQLDVERIDVPSRAHPGSVNIEGILDMDVPLG